MDVPDRLRDELRRFIEESCPPAMRAVMRAKKRWNLPISEFSCCPWWEAWWCSAPYWTRPMAVA